jgi:hypothetical protein
VPIGVDAEAVLEATDGEAEVAKPEFAGAAEDTGTMATLVEEAGAELAAGALEATGAAEALPPELEPADPPPPIPLTAAQVPVTAPAPLPVPVTSGPGLGKVTSLPSTVLQPLARLATKMPGRAEKAVAGASRFFPPAMVIDAQFM